MINKIQKDLDLNLKERASDEEIQRQVLLFQNNEVLNEFLGKIPMVFLIVNKYRQIVYLNEGALELTNMDDVASAVGKRPGELIGCIHSTERSTGCGTVEACTYCGALDAVLESQKGNPTTRECQLILNTNSALNLRIHAASLSINGEKFTAITLQDIQHEKWRLFLEQIFFHDLLNSVSTLKGIFDLLENYKEKLNENDLIKMAGDVIQGLIEEIQSQHLLINAENNRLKISIDTFNTMNLLEEIYKTYKEHDLVKGKSFQLDSNSASITITSDRTLLKRILINMIKNALEATPENGKVLFGCKQKKAQVQFWVHNPGFIPRDVQLQIFNRSFSTKNPNRGLGTYSMKFLSSFLKGAVSFTTSEEEGTRFTAEFPISLNED